MAQDNPDRSDELIAMANEMMDQADKAETLKKEGYAPYLGLVITPWTWW